MLFVWESGGAFWSHVHESFGRRVCGVLSAGDADREC